MLKVPEGTVVYEAVSGQVIADLPLEEKTFRKPEGLEMEKTGDGLTFRAVSRNNSVLLPAVDDGKVMEQLKNTMDPRQMRLNIALLILTDFLFLLLQITPCMIKPMNSP